MIVSEASSLAWTIRLVAMHSVRGMGHSIDGRVSSNG